MADTSTPAKRKPHRSWSDVEKRRVVRFYNNHGHGPTLEKYKVSSGMLHIWRHDPRYGSAPTKAAPASRQSKPRGNGVDRTTRVLLEKAWQLIEAEVKSGADLRDSDLYVKLALNAVTKRP